MIPKLTLKIQNPLLKQIIGIILIAGGIELFGLCLTIFINNTQQKSYEEIIENEYSIIRDVNEIMISAYQMKSLVVNYASGTNTQEDYQLEISQKREYISAYVKALNEDVTASGKHYYVDRLTDINLQYDNYEEGLEIILGLLSAGEDVTVEYIDEKIGAPIEYINQYCDVIQMYADISESEKNSSIKTLTTISRAIEVFVVIITAGSIFMCMYISDKNGTEMAQNQAKAEQRAANNAKKAYTDGLTKLWNRAYTEKAVTNHIQNKSKGCLFMMDMDNFKSVNDTYGHIAGDNVLKTFANVLMQNARDYDICCRIGGDEFMMFILNIDGKTSMNIANRIMNTAKEQLAKIDGGKFVTVSIGGALLTEDIQSFKELYDRADAALETVKEHGKAAYKLYSRSDQREKGVDLPEKNSRKGLVGK